MVSMTKTEEWRLYSVEW